MIRRSIDHQMIISQMIKVKMTKKISLDNDETKPQTKNTSEAICSKSQNKETFLKE